MSFSSRVYKLKTPTEPLELATILLLKRVTAALDRATERVEIFLEDEVVHAILARFQQDLAEEGLRADICANFSFSTKLSNEGYKKPHEPLTQIITKASGETPADFTIFHGDRTYDLFLPEGQKVGMIKLQRGAIKKDSNMTLNQEVQNIIRQLTDQFQ